MMAVVLFAYGCSGLQHAGNHSLQDGYYVFKTDSTAARPVYARFTDSSLVVHARSGKKGLPLPQPFFETALGAAATDSMASPSFRLVKKSIDLDLSTVLFKFRFSRMALPNQLSSQLNVTLYGGYRQDYYRLRTHKTPLQQYQHSLRHLAFDLGAFAGFGSTPVNPSVTGGAVAEEYDGIVFQKGVAFFIGSNRFTAGISVGTDALLDRNRKNWLYRERPWLGLMIGLNLSD